MTTDRQMEANRKNALLSTGPKTEDGKAVVSANAIKHGILTNKVFVQEEFQEEFEKMREGFYREFQPRGTVEAFLLERVISCSWRLVLITQVEGEMLDAESSYGAIKGAFEGQGSCNMTSLARYEHFLEKSLYRALEALRQAQCSHKESIVEIGFVS